MTKTLLEETSHDNGELQTLNVILLGVVKLYTAKGDLIATPAVCLVFINVVVPKTLQP
jgi:hypothetical protein